MCRCSCVGSVTDFDRCRRRSDGSQHAAEATALSEYDALRKLWSEDWRPEGAAEEYCIEEIIANIWKLNVVEKLVEKEFERRTRTSNKSEGIGVFDNDLELPIESFDLPLDRAWDCEKVMVRAFSDRPGASSPSPKPGSFGNTFGDFMTSQGNRDGRHLEIQAVLGSSLDTLMRYQTRLKKDLYKAIDLLRVKSQAPGSGLVTMRLGSGG